MKNSLKLKHVIGLRGSKMKDILKNILLYLLFLFFPFVFKPILFCFLSIIRFDELKTILDTIWIFTILPIYYITKKIRFLKHSVHYKLLFLFLNFYLFSIHSWLGIGTIMDFFITHVPDEDFIPFLFVLITDNAILLLGYFLNRTGE